MHGIYNLKELLCQELEEYGKKDRISQADLQIVDTLAHATKNLCKIVEDSDGGESYRGMSYEGDSYRSYDNSGRRSRVTGRYVSRSYGSEKDHIAQKLEDLMSETTDPNSKQAIQQALSLIR